MNEHDILEANKLNEALENVEAIPFSPVKMVENALYDFLSYRVMLLKNDLSFQKDLKDALRARIPEADFNDIRILLDQSERSTNTSLTSTMAPFLNKLQDTVKTKEKSVEENIFESSSKETLQAFNEVYQVMQQLNKASKEKKDTSSLKEALKESLQ